MCCSSLFLCVYRKNHVKLSISMSLLDRTLAVVKWDFLLWGVAAEGAHLLGGVVAEEVAEG